MSKRLRSSDNVCPIFGFKVTVQQVVVVVVDIFTRPIDYMYLILLYLDPMVQGSSVVC